MSTATEHSPLPNRHLLRSTIETLTGCDVMLGDGVPAQARTTNVVAVYVTDRLATAALVILDLAGAARLGGSIGRVPKGGVDDAIARRALNDTLEHGCQQAFESLAAAFNVPGAPHVRLYEMYGPNQPLPPDVAALAGVAGSRMDVQFGIYGYGTGKLSIVVRQER
jgi:hypothetical protein